MNVRRFVSSHHAVLLVNLCVALIVANVIFLSGVDKTWLHVRTSYTRMIVLVNASSFVAD